MTETPSANWLVRRPAHGPPRARLFCFAHAGVGASAYRGWAAELPSYLEVCAVQLPGRESRLREPPFQHMAPLIDALLPVLEPLLDRPFALFGHSMGALVAAEVSVALRAAGAPTPLHLFVSGHRAPHLPDPDPPLGGLDDAAFVAEINRRYGGIPAEILAERELLELLLPGLRADIRVLESRPAGGVLVFDCPLSIFGGTDDRRATPAQLAAWREGARASARVRMFPGGHFYLSERRTELLADIAATLDADLAAVVQSRTTPPPLAWSKG